MCFICFEAAACKSRQKGPYDCEKERERERAPEPVKNELFAFGWKTSIVSPLIFSAQSVDLTIFAVVVRALSLFAFTLALFHTITELM